MQEQHPEEPVSVVEQAVHTVAVPAVCTAVAQEQVLWQCWPEHLLLSCRLQIPDVPQRYL